MSTSIPSIAETCHVAFLYVREYTMQALFEYTFLVCYTFPLLQQMPSLPYNSSFDVLFMPPLIFLHFIPPIGPLDPSTPSLLPPPSLFSHLTLHRD